MSDAGAQDPNFGALCAPAAPALLVFAHADDETIALGARLRHLNIVRLVHVTDGTPPDEQDSRRYGFASLDEYRHARLQELHTMLSAAGIPETRCDHLGIPDQMAAFHLAEISRRLAAILDSTSPAVIFTHPYEGGHPDHDACAFAVRRAVNLASAPAPRVVECAFYHAGPEGIETGSFLPHPGASQPLVCHLDSEEQALKASLLDCFPTQRETLRYFPRDRESFRLAPGTGNRSGYDFSRPPHPGRLFYENFPWGMTAPRFRRLAAEAGSQLFSEEASALCL